MAEKPLDDKLKEAEIAKLKQETALIRKQVNAKWYTGKSLRLSKKVSHNTNQ